MHWLSLVYFCWNPDPVGTKDQEINCSFCLVFLKLGYDYRALSAIGRSNHVTVLRDQVF